MKILVGVKGGPGSGNWGHSGRPGMVGGSGGRGAGVNPMLARMRAEPTPEHEESVRKVLGKSKYDLLDAADDVRKKYPGVQSSASEGGGKYTLSMVFKTGRYDGEDVASRASGFLERQGYTITASVVTPQRRTTNIRIVAE